MRLRLIRGPSVRQLLEPRLRAHERGLARFELQREGRFRLQREGRLRRRVRLRVRLRLRLGARAELEQRGLVGSRTRALHGVELELPQTSS